MRVVIAEDAAMMREGLTRLLTERGHEVCAAVADGEALLAAVAQHRPDVAVVDVRMPPTHTDEGLRAALELRGRHPAPECWCSRSTSRPGTRLSCWQAAP